jgi:hypothetical protein
MRTCTFEECPQLVGPGGGRCYYHTKVDAGLFDNPPRPRLPSTKDGWVPADSLRYPDDEWTTERQRLAVMMEEPGTIIGSVSPTDSPYGSSWSRDTNPSFENAIRVIEEAMGR